MRTWIIGAGGLFGSALARAAEDPFLGPTIPWQHPDAALTVLTSTLENFSQTTDGDWCIAWAAGRATTSSSREEVAEELTLFTQFIDHLAEHQPTGRGVFLLTSSAGGVYAGSAHPPFTSASTPHPLGTYGDLKLAQERVTQGALRSPVVTARVSNLYGPGQDLRKIQGLLSRLALAAVTKQPVRMYVPLDTIRDYIHSDDAAIRALHWVRIALQAQESAVRVVASGQPQTLGHVIALMRDITRVRIPVAMGVDASASAQSPDLRLIPDHDAVTTALPLTPLPAGMKQVYLDIVQRHAASLLPA